MEYDLRETGWFFERSGITSSDQLAKRLLQIATAIGTPMTGAHNNLIEVVRPRHRGVGKPITLSGKFGLEAFPLHCDTAHWPVPSRYLLLACQNRGVVGTETLLLDTSSLPLTEAEIELAKSELFHVRNGRKSFYSSILSPMRPFVRVDPGCLDPASPRGAEALALYDAERWGARVIKIDWRLGDILVVDNWRTLHGRAEARGEDRSLLRCIVR
jgi:hypothetical protein